MWVERYENGDKENLVQFITNVRKSIGVDTNYTADGRFLFVDLEEPMKYYGPDRGELFVVRGEHGEILGSIGYSKIEPGVCELKKVYLDSSLRGRGLAEKLLTEMINRATQSGFKKMILQTNSRMTNAIGLYLKLGFEKMPDKEALNSTAIYYYLNLTEN
ncbi:MAG TPA: GNAT family N-acetyltransferase [Bdellovibrio sp.]|nr:GNAT family N-acetyltransferase [Bdellovibrio sp.]